jgi:hypothetical protein
MSYKFKNQTFIDSLVCEKDNCIDESMKSGFSCLSFNDFIGIPFFQIEKRIPYSVMSVKPKYNYFTGKGEKVHNEFFIMNIGVHGLVIIIYSIYKIIFYTDDENNVLYVLTNSRNINSSACIPVKMPEKFSSLITNEKDRTCSICWVVLENNEIYTSSLCYCGVYHKECFEMGGNKCAYCKKGNNDMEG